MSIFETAVVVLALYQLLLTWQYAKLREEVRRTVDGYFEEQHKINKLFAEQIDNLREVVGGVRKDLAAIITGLEKEK